MTEWVIRVIRAIRVSMIMMRLDEYDGFSTQAMSVSPLALVSQVHARVCVCVCLCVHVCVCVWWVCMSVCVWELFWVKTTFIEATTARGCCVRGC